MHELGPKRPEPFMAPHGKGGGSSQQWPWTLSRRLFIATSVLATGAVLEVACTPNNNASVEDLRRKLGIIPSTSRESFAQSAAHLATNPAAFVGSRIEYTSELGKKVRIEVDRGGEPRVLDVLSSVVVEYPDSGTARLNPTVQTISANNRHLVVYGTQGTIDRVRKNETVVHEFLSEYFGSINKPCVLHIIFLPQAQNIPLLDIGNMGDSPRAHPTSLARLGTLYDKETNDVLKYDIIVNIPLTHRYAAEVGYSEKEIMVQNLANEATDMFVYETWPRVGREHSPQGISTLTGILASIDKSTAKMILGDSHEKFVKIIVDEMQRIGKPKKIK